ncbi:MAG: CsgG/HfaB family protein [Spirochaetales bacterium]|uniref:CsgG/HfaB family protein n=1 Tax=Candidatus Thalassospirochaeta sargassi TaxID=3119039 RepID=A0AAJ1IFC2_9SPIO|nr:CsgG/HfaB family protein [Spirochaetales bacterium]
MNIKRLIFLVLLIAAILAAPAFSKDRVAVLDFEAKDIDLSDALAIADLFRSDLVATGVYIVLERGNMQSILNEHQLQMSGLVNEASASEIGELLSVNYLFLGNLSKFGNKFILVIDKINVETGEIEKSVKKSAVNMDDFLDLSAEAAAELADSTEALAVINQNIGYDAATLTEYVEQIGFFSMIELRKIDFNERTMQESNLDVRREIYDDYELSNAGRYAFVNFITFGLNIGSFRQGFDELGYTGIAATGLFVMSLFTDSLVAKILTGTIWASSWLGSVATPFMYEANYNQQLKDTLLVY